jgi:aromatic ring-opening dioxygenase catalytic subunit (LigB family)
MSSEAKTGRMPAYYLPHGGGPCFFMNWPGDPDAWNNLAAFLRGVLPALPALPRAIVVISAHWEQPAASVTANPKPELIYDYSG